MYYEINIAYNGKHLFATANRSISSRQSLLEVLPVLAKRFPASEGFSLTCTKYMEVGNPVDISDMINTPEVLKAPDPIKSKLLELAQNQESYLLKTRELAHKQNKPMPKSFDHERAKLIGIIDSLQAIGVNTEEFKWIFTV